MKVAFEWRYRSRRPVAHGGIGVLVAERSKVL
jgi:hypothetical protein